MNNICKKPLFNLDDCIYTGGICHKNYFLFLNPNNCEVVVFDKCLKKIGNIKSEKYESITENNTECYFILTKVGDMDYLYKATYDFLEFDSIKLNIPNKYKGKINDIYCNLKNKRIYITTNNYVYSVTLDGYFIKEEAYNNYKQQTTVYKNLNGCCAPINCNKNIFKFQAVGMCNEMFVSYIKNNEAVLSTLDNVECKNEICLGSDIEVLSIFVCCNKLYLLILKNGKYNYIYELNMECDTCEVKTCLPCCEPFNNCNQDSILPCCEPLGNCNKRKCTDYTACILESIALEQTALSHILNAEGEKIQQAVKCNANICDLLKINESVKETIFNTTMLEHVLHQKMESIIKYDKNCKCRK